MRTVLVTGVGAIIGYGIIRSLRLCKEPFKIVGIDIYPDAVGQKWCDYFELALRTDDPNYIGYLRDLIDRYQVDLLFPGIEQDVNCWANVWREISSFSSRFVLNEPDLIRVADDKWLTHQAIVQAGLAVIPSVIDGTFEELSQRFGLPFLVKPRRSYASKGIVIIETALDFDYWREKMGADFLAQKIVGKEDAEYTVGVFGDGQGDVAAHIMLKRKLSREGATAKAEVCFDNVLSHTVRNLCKHFKPLGPCNFQFRKQRDDYLLLEINPRISSSTSLRQAFGYNEASFCIDFFLDGKLPVQPSIMPGRAVRYIEDWVLL